MKRMQVHENQDKADRLNELGQSIIKEMKDFSSTLNRPGRQATVRDPLAASRLIDKAVELAERIEDELIRESLYPMLPRDRPTLEGFDGLHSYVGFISDKVSLDRRRLKSAFRGCDTHMHSLNAKSEVLGTIAPQFGDRNGRLDDEGRNAVLEQFNKAKEDFADLLAEEMDAVRILFEAEMPDTLERDDDD